MAKNTSSQCFTAPIEVPQKWIAQFALYDQVKLRWKPWETCEQHEKKGFIIWSKSDKIAKFSIYQYVNFTVKSLWGLL